MKHIDLEEFAGGGFTEQVNKALEDVARNIQDPNTDAKAARKITVTITMKPNDSRDFVTTGVVTKCTLAPSLGVVTAMTVGKDLKTGKVAAVEIGNQVPGQMSFADREEASESAVKNLVDPDTGEVVEVAIESETKNNKVINLRQA